MFLYICCSSILTERERVCIRPQAHLDASCKLILHASAFDCVSHLFKPHTPQHCKQKQTTATQEVTLRESENQTGAAHYHSVYNYDTLSMGMSFDQSALCSQQHTFNIN